MKKSNILQLNNSFIQSERQKNQHFHEERQRKNRFSHFFVYIAYLQLSSKLW